MGFFQPSNLYGPRQPLKSFLLLSVENDDLATVVSILEEVETHMPLGKLPPDSIPCEQRWLQLREWILLSIFVVPLYSEGLRWSFAAFVKAVTAFLV